MRLLQRRFNFSLTRSNCDQDAKSKLHHHRILYSYQRRRAASISSCDLNHRHHLPSPFELLMTNKTILKSSQICPHWDCITKKYYVVSPRKSSSSSPLKKKSNSKSSKLVHRMEAKKNSSSVQEEKFSDYKSLLIFFCSSRHHSPFHV